MDDIDELFLRTVTWTGTLTSNLVNEIVNKCDEIVLSHSDFWWLYNLNSEAQNLPQVEQRTSSSNGKAQLLKLVPLLTRFLMGISMINLKSLDSKTACGVPSHTVECVSSSVECCIAQEQHCKWSLYYFFGLGVGVIDYFSYWRKKYCNQFLFL